MKYCKKCLQPDTRPNIKFTCDGICPACVYYGKIQGVDWEERAEIFREIITTYPRKPGQYFDCIIGVSGGKDSTRQALWVRDKFGLNPLLVCLSYPPEQVTHRGAENISNLIELGFDTIVSAPAPGTWKRLMRKAFLEFTNWCKSTEYALHAAVPQEAIRHQIPLIFWGENDALQFGDLKTLGKTGYDGNNLRDMNTLSGGQADWMLDSETGLLDIQTYQYPSKEQFDQHGIQIVFLGWFFPDWSFVDNGMYAVTEGLELRSDTASNTGDLKGVTALDEDWVTLNQMIKYYKFGFGRASDYLNEEIRAGRIERTDAITIAEEYDGCCSSEYISSFCDYIEITVEEFWAQVGTSVNRDLFDVDKSGVIRRKFAVGVGL